MHGVRKSREGQGQIYEPPYSSDGQLLAITIDKLQIKVMAKLVYLSDII